MATEFCKKWPHHHFGCSFLFVVLQWGEGYTDYTDQLPDGLLLRCLIDGTQ